MNELVKQVKTKSMGCWSRLVENARKCDDFADMRSFVSLFGILLLAGAGVIFLLGMILIYAPWIFLTFLVAFGIPTEFLAWVKMRDKSDNQPN